jgi:hypothetical protein
MVCVFPSPSIARHPPEARDAIAHRVSAHKAKLQTILGAFSPRHPWLTIRLKHAMQSCIA